jgi:hypothetical protein
VSGDALDAELQRTHVRGGPPPPPDPKPAARTAQWARQPAPHRAYLAGSRGNLKKARSDCVLFRVQLGAAQKSGIVAHPPAGPAFPSLPPQGSVPPVGAGEGSKAGWLSRAASAALSSFLSI